MPPTVPAGDSHDDGTDPHAVARKAPDMPRSDKPARAVAPWVRTRLRTAPWAAASLALLVLVTAYLAAALPRAVDRYETEGLQHDIRAAAPRDAVLELTTPIPVGERGHGLAPAVLQGQEDRARELLPEPIRTDPRQTVHGVRTVKRVEGTDAWLPRPDGISPEFVLSSPSRLTEHATLRAGRLAAGSAAAPEAVVTTRTAASLHLKPGSVVHVPSKSSATPIAVTVTGVVEPRGLTTPYWAVEPLLGTPALAPLVGEEVKYYWQAALLLSPSSAAAVLSTSSELEVFFRFMPTAGHLTGRDTDRLGAALDSAAGGPDLVKLRKAVGGGNAALTTELDSITDSYLSMRGAIDPVVAVAVFGIGAVAAVVLAMTGGLFVARRDGELALIRSRGASLTGIGLRLLGETSAVTVPAAALALGLAVLTVRPPGGSGEIPLTPSVLVRIYPLPLRWLGRPARRLRGVVGPLALARAGRSSSSGTLPLLALVLALSTAAFGGSVLAGVADARHRAALLATGADARVSGSVEWTPLPAGLTEEVRGLRGVRDVAPVQIEYGVALPSSQGTSAQPMSAPIVGVDPDSYTRLAGRTGFGPFSAGLLASTGRGGEDAVADTGRVLPAIASPSVAERLGDAPQEIVSAAGVFKVKVVAVRSTTPALDEADFLLVNGADLTHRADTSLLVTGSMDGVALRAAVRAKAGGAGSGSLVVAMRSEARATYVDSPLQSGAERIYLGAIGAGAALAVVAVLLSLLQSAPERTTFLARLRTMGLTRKQSRRLLGLEALPQAVLAALGGMLVGWATVPLLAPGIDLVRLALAAAPGFAPLDSAPLRADPWSLLLPALAVVVLTGLAAVAQAWWAARRGSIKELRAGDAR
ncbi:FtsX-like permease family protein [Streptomyces sp. NPDC059082]|uniref:FtsX-like permease family protein n=1 Tax=Streptomyces sp. NPDC059082 TaxID=3346720 RepID=UPI0036939751